VLLLSSTLSTPRDDSDEEHVAPGVLSWPLGLDFVKPLSLPIAKDDAKVRNKLMA
jgi:hypothetical protein